MSERQIPTISGSFHRTYILKRNQSIPQWKYVCPDLNITENDVLTFWVIAHKHKKQYCSLIYEFESGRGVIRTDIVPLQYRHRSQQIQATGDLRMTSW